ncbi:uncharacterized protein LOC106770423 [Vigna radiata var. radiata]|uniref:Uncharacterized protein LOC106770423 n=1 Tax=Vigna radiata var. radiata TaxID=3916 RepID=A0A1S3V086_VIGRR|nr:uncharacterized protein LOC106770423 [Vigna radiata var. radiata]
MTRANHSPLLTLDPEIGRTRKGIKKEKHHSESEVTGTFPPSFECISDTSESEDMAAEQRERTLKELANQEIGFQPLCIQVPYVQGAPNFDLRSGFIQLLPRFHGLVGEDPHKHIMEFTVICSTMKPLDVPEEIVKMKAFPFSLQDAAKEWLFSQNVPIASWGEMKRKFLERFFPASRTAAVRKEISGIRQLPGENLFEYWERFKRLCSTCPNHQISEQLLLQYFYEGLLIQERNMIDAASGGTLMDKTPSAARNLIANMAENYQQTFTRGGSSKGVHEMQLNAISDTVRTNMFTGNNLLLGNKILELIELIGQMAVGGQASAVKKHCGLCASDQHFTDQCAQIQDSFGAESVAAAYQGQQSNFRQTHQPWQTQNQQQHYNQGSSSQNQGWRNWMNPRYEPHPYNQQGSQQTNGPMQSMNQYTQQYRQNQSQMQPKMDPNLAATIQDLKMQIGQLAHAVNELVNQKVGGIPAQPVVNPKEPPSKT